MYMSELVELAETLSLDWRTLPVGMLPALNVHWEYGACYPMVRYHRSFCSCDKGVEEEEDEDGEEEQSVMQQVAQRLSNANAAALFLHPTRYSMMLWIMDSASRSYESVHEDDEWTPRMVLGHEFSLLPFMYPHAYPNHRQRHLLGQEDSVSVLQTTGCSSMQVMQNKLFQLGFGPLPFFRRYALFSLSLSFSRYLSIYLRLALFPEMHGCQRNADNAHEAQARRAAAHLRVRSRPRRRHEAQAGRGGMPQARHPRMQVCCCPWRFSARGRALLLLPGTYAACVLKPDAG